MLRYFITGDLDLAICESDRTAARYTMANGWHEVSRAALCYVWMCRDGARLYQLAVAARKATPAPVIAPLNERAVGHIV